MKEASKAPLLVSREGFCIVQALGDAGYFLPMEALFQMGLPKKTLLLNVT